MKPAACADCAALRREVVTLTREVRQLQWVVLGGMDRPPFPMPRWMREAESLRRVDGVLVPAERLGVR